MSSDLVSTSSSINLFVDSYYISFAWSSLSISKAKAFVISLKSSGNRLDFYPSC